MTNEFSDNPIFLNLRGEMLLRRDEVAEAIKVLERASQRNPNDSGITRNHVNAYQNRNNRSLATSQGLAPHQLSISYNKIIESCEESFSALNDRRDNLFKRLAILIPIFWTSIFCAVNFLISGSFSLAWCETATFTAWRKGAWVGTACNFCHYFRLFNCISCNAVVVGSQKNFVRPKVEQTCIRRLRTKTIFTEFCSNKQPT